MCRGRAQIVSTHGPRAVLTHYLSVLPSKGAATLQLAAAKKPTEEVFRLDYRIFNSIRPQHEKMGAKKSKKERTLQNVKQEHAKDTNLGNAY